MIKTELLRLIADWRLAALRNYRRANDGMVGPVDKRVARELAAVQADYADQLEKLLSLMADPARSSDVTVSAGGWATLCALVDLPPSSDVDAIVQQLDVVLRAPGVPYFLDAHTDGLADALVLSQLFQDLEDTFGGQWDDHAQKVVKIVRDYYARAYLTAVPRRSVEDIARSIAQTVEAQA